MFFTSRMRPRILLGSGTALVVGAAVWLALGLGNAGRQRPRPRRLK